MAASGARYAAHPGAAPAPPPKLMDRRLTTMKTATVLPLLAVGVTMLMAVTAVPMSAVPVPFATGIPGVAGTFDDNLDSFTLVLSGGVVTNNVQTPSPILLGANWPTQLTITLNDANSDFVLISG